ncbi:drug resistance transporter EmrB/QacA subfamily [Apiospora aurea]|uniref:Drug resistance transporter EmrB/QacA subfamily n=1 Tax=Apiospora aurea TaxID=335848 RepID=A0ABR1QHC1_9PEZI
MDNIKLHNYSQEHPRTSGEGPNSHPVSLHGLKQQDTNEDEDKPQVAKLDQLSGWRLWVTHSCLLLGLFMATIESSIVTTALVPIAEALMDFQNANWVVAAYLITYTAFLIIFARISDLCGRKPTLIAAITIFTVFSGACTAAQTMTQLIILRAFQGIGGAGLYSLAMSIVLEVTPPKHIGLATGLFGPTFVLSNLLGPVLGGFLTTSLSWRLVFFINLPTGIILLCVLGWIFPANSTPLPLSRRTLSFVDWPGMFLSLLGVISLIYALEKGGARQRWASPDIIATLALSGVGLVGFVTWEWIVSDPRKKRTRMLPLFPIRLIWGSTPASIPGLLPLPSLFAIPTHQHCSTAFLVGFPFLITTTGFRMLPLLLLAAGGAGVGAVVGSKFNISWHILASSLALQIVGLGLMATLPTSGDVSSAQYGYQVLLGFGFGLSLSSITIGAVTQVRTLGGLMGIAIAQAVVFGEIYLKLEKKLSYDTLDMILVSPRPVAKLAPHDKEMVINAYGVAFNLINIIAVGVCIAALIACMGIWRRKRLSITDTGV